MPTTKPQSGRTAEATREPERACDTQRLAREEATTEVRRTPAGGSRACVRRRVLVVDDNEDCCELLRHFLSGRGHDVSTATDGVMALELVKLLTPDIVLLDVGLPGVSGFEVVERLRADGVAIPIVGVSGHAGDEARRRAENAGFSAYITKPIDLSQIGRLVDASTTRSA